MHLRTYEFSLSYYNKKVNTCLYTNTRVTQLTSNIKLERLYESIIQYGSYVLYKLSPTLQQHYLHSFLRERNIKKS